MNQNELRSWAAEREEILFWEDIDEDELRVPGGYNPTFTPGPDTIVIGAGWRSSDLAQSVELPEEGGTTLATLVAAAIAAAWEIDATELHDRSDFTEERVVGHSEIDDIWSSTALLYSRKEDPMVEAFGG